MPSYVKAEVDPNQGGSLAGKEVEILADDYTSKGDEELVEVKIGDDIVFIEKKFIKLKSETLDPAVKSEVDEDFNIKTPTSFSGVANVKEEEEEMVGSPTDVEVLRARLKKSLQDLEETREDMRSTFTSSSTLSATIQSLKGMIDALKKDQENLKGGLN